MSSPNTIDTLTSALVARYLRTNNYTETLQALIREAELEPDVGQSSGDDTNGWTIQNLLEEKRAFDHSVNFERYGQSKEPDNLWSTPAPSTPTIVETPTSSNLLAASVEVWQKPQDDENSTGQPFIISTGADRRVHLLKTEVGNPAFASFSGLSDSPVLSYVILQGRYILMTNMSGHLLLQDGAHVLDTRKDHMKYAVKVVAYEEQGDSNSPKKIWLATAGWDAKILIYQISIPAGESDTSSIVIGEPVACIKTTTNPESLLFVRHINSDELLLLVSRRDSTHIYYYQVEYPSKTDNDSIQGSSVPECDLLGRQNLAPHSNTWVAFSPAYMALSPHDRGLLAVATSTLPHLKVMIVRLLFPSKTLVTDAVSEPVTQASQALEALQLHNREDAAILVQANTFAPQTEYSTPQVAWRPDGSGVWVNGDDGVIRGIETKTGKLIATLKDGHEPGCKVRTIWAGYVNVNGNEAEQEEWMISGGFDKKLIVWKV
ncbi:hypothetical protein N7495_004982 [Penicillium taxi]|uniref:uncharacterized protein n=1 Tax=Penicillium taxi TaxID=168475 RepID=UPI0025450533|nr:uncharacterized protein N7495_004982 [Penicillium taxi]KAJ5893291.1 hypothetical protein N7495_004982 [Penicillium taxi]